jgi:hypothetical protein
MADFMEIESDNCDFLPFQAGMEKSIDTLRVRLTLRVS